MKKTIMIVTAIMLTTVSYSQAYDTYVNGYTSNNGTYVQPYYRTAPDSNRFNNYSSQGNVNPYNGRIGTVNPYNNYSRF